MVKGLAEEEPDIVWEDSCPSVSSHDAVCSIHSNGPHKGQLIFSGQDEQVSPQV